MSPFCSIHPNIVLWLIIVFFFLWFTHPRALYNEQELITKRNISCFTLIQRILRSNNILDMRKKNFIVICGIVLKYYPCFHSHLCIFVYSKTVQAKLTHKPIICIILAPITNICSLEVKSWRSSNLHPLPGLLVLEESLLTCLRETDLLPSV